MNLNNKLTIKEENNMKYLKNKVNIIGIIFVALIAMNSCKKENKEEINLSKSNLKHIPIKIKDMGMIYFENTDDFMSAMEQILAVDYIERAEYENAYGYTSFGRLCDDIYYSSIDEEKGLQTAAEFDAFISSHSNYVQFKEDNDGEILYVPRLFNNPYRYFISENNRIFQVEEMYIKVFETGNVMVNADNLRLLIDLEEEGLSSIVEDDPIFAYSPIGLSTRKSHKANISNNYYFNAATNKAGDERIRIEAFRAYNNNFFRNNYYVYNSIKAFRKVLWFWSDAKRTIRYSLNYNYEYTAKSTTSPYFDRTVYDTDYSSYTGSDTKYRYEFTKCFQTTLYKDYKFTKLSGYVSIPAVTCSF